MTSNSTPTLEIIPIINRSKGVEAEDLSTNSNILVRLSEDSAKKFDVPVKDNGVTPPLSARFKSFSRSSKNSRGKLRVELTNGIHGVCKIPEDAKLRPNDRSFQDGYNSMLQGIILFLSFSLVILTLFITYDILLI